MLTKEQRWKKTVKWLREVFPAIKPVIVRRIDIVDDGETFICKKSFCINIKKRAAVSLQLDAVLHEWAHVLTWYGNDTDDHGEEWALAYGRIYRSFVEWRYGK